MACLKLFAVISGINYRILVPLLGLRAVAAQVRISAIVTMGGYQFLKIGYSTERLTTGDRENAPLILYGMSLLGSSSKQVSLLWPLYSNRMSYGWIYGLARVFGWYYALISSQYWKPPIFYDDDDEESSIPLRDIISELPLSVEITPNLPITDSLIIEDEHLNTILETESDEENESSVKDLNPIPSESEDTFESDSDCDLSLCDDFSPINVYEEKSVTFSNPLFDSNDDFTSSDDESLSDEDVPEDNVKIYSNPLFKFDDEYISSDVNPLFDEVLEDIESKDSYVSNLDEPALLVTPLSDDNEDEYFDPGGDVNEIEFLLHRDPFIPKISVASILERFTDEPPFEENDDLFDLESKDNEWKKILYDASIDDLMTEDKNNF
ncbi:hypothetical protein Tco_1191663 [Tanacetum coccineum]